MQLNDMLSLDIENIPQKLDILYNILCFREMEQCLNIDKTMIYKFIILIKEGYIIYKHDKNSTPQYHTFQHALDVTYIVHVLLSYTSIGHTLSNEDKMLLLISALLHDIGHSGLTNTYLNNSNNILIKEYGKESPLERYHIDVGKHIIKESKIFEQITYIKQVKYMNIIEKCILATDIQTYTNNSIDTMCTIMRCADISNCFRTFEIFTKWSKRLKLEFIEQVILEVEQGLKQTINVTDDMTKKFVDRIALQLFEQVAITVPEFSIILNNIKDNLSKM